MQAADLVDSSSGSGGGSSGEGIAKPVAMTPHQAQVASLKKTLNDKRKQKQRKQQQQQQQQQSLPSLLPPPPPLADALLQEEDVITDWGLMMHNKRSWICWRQR